MSKSFALYIGVALLLGGCGGGAATTGNAADTSPTSTMPPTSTIKLAGTPPTTITAGTLYTFQPSVSESGGGTVSFSITGQPAWASFNDSTGELSGTPSDTEVGMSASITITASDGGTTASVGPFTIDVKPPAPTSGSASLSWVPPAQNTDGSPVTDLAGYHIHYGTSADALTQTIDIAGATTTAYVINDLSSGTYYFTITVYTAMGIESAPSNVASKTI